tara:strand:+ start:827 stop:1366 length:540 start_codon:yes stop_codon:yes gene_type:complete
MSEDFGAKTIEMMPKLRAFAISLCGNRTLADDLVQDTLIKAWAARDRFEPGTNLNAWLHTILRNNYFSQLRKTKRSVEDPDGSYEASMTSKAAQDGRIEYRDLCRALSALPPEQREAIILTSAGGFSYEEVAQIAGCAVGTVKSRVNRARVALTRQMDSGAEPQDVALTGGENTLRSLR